MLPLELASVVLEMAIGEDKTLMELEPDEKITIFKMVDAFLTKKKFKDFFPKNISTL